MKRTLSFSQLVVVSMLAVLTAFSSSCMNAYDSQGRPMQTVDPGVAIAGAAAAGVLGYAIADNRSSRRDRHHHHHHGYYAPRYGGHRGGYYHRGHRGGYYRR